MTAYMRWAVDDVLAYGPSGSRVAPNLPMPRWSWDGLIDDAHQKGGSPR
jgi:hemoglobin